MESKATANFIKKNSKFRFVRSEPVSDLKVLKAIWDNNYWLPPLNVYNLSELENIKRLMRTFRIINPDVLTGMWVLKKRNSEHLYKRRFIWIDPIANMFFWYDK